jgi:hypothetical protein
VERKKEERIAMKHKLLALALAVALLALPRAARAFCGFYVSGADAKLFNNATQVVLMREGTRTVLSMQNNYQGPPENFAMVVPVGVVLQKENVKTLTRDIFDRVDQLTSPRLVEYWEQDPCPKPLPRMYDMATRGAGGPPMPAPAAAPVATAPMVKIEAQFAVGEYEIVILSANDSTALDAWLHQNGYKIPDGAEPYLRPYVQQGYKFFVAKVDVNKVTFQQIGNGPRTAVLSPLRFHYDSDAFNLPIRLGLINSGGTQDLIVNILAQGQRYEAANYENIAIRTNLDLNEAAKGEFPGFYTSLFDKTLESHPHAVVTEYAWMAQSCDPCPTPPLDVGDLLTLGGDVLPSMQGMASQQGGPPAMPRRPGPWMGMPMNGFVVTRLHARYSKDALGDDLFFRAAPPIVGGREFLQDGGKLEQGARPDATNNFQARYAIRHPWKGPIACAHPQRGVWGGPPGQPWGMPPVQPAAKIAYAPHQNLQLAALLKGPLPPESVLSAASPTPLLSFPATTSDTDAAVPAPMTAPEPPDAAGIGTPVPPRLAPPEGGCGGCTVGATGGGACAVLFASLAFGAFAVRRPRRRR